MKKLLLYFFIVMSGTMTATTIKNRDAGPTAVSLTITDAACGSADGSITFGTVTGGVAPFTYSIDNGATFSTATTYYGLVPNTYNLAVKDANGDVFNTSASIIDKPGPTAIATAIMNATCGLSNGSVTITGVTGGTAPYIYDFGYGYSSAISFTLLAAGTYTIAVRDANGCIYTTTVTITVSAGPTNIVTTSTDSHCGASDGSITLGAVTDGFAPYSYSFNVPSGLGPYTGTTVYTGLVAGSYSLEVKDANGCFFLKTVLVGNTPGITAIANTLTNVSVCGASDGSITINSVTGGVAPYQYNFDNLGYFSANNQSGLNEGIHTIAVKDSNGCIYNITFIIGNTSISAPTIASVTQPTCAVPTGTIVFTTQSGVEYSIDNGVSYQASTAFPGLATGTYILMVRNTVGTICTAMGANPVTLNLATPLIPTTASITQASCAVPTGTIVVNSQAGVEYSINNGATYQASTTFSGLTPGTYTITVRNTADNTCTATAVTNVIINAVPSAPAVPTFTITQPSCAQPTGTIVVATQPGVEYSIINGAIYQASNTFSGVSPGTYTIRVRNSTDTTCSTNAATTATINSVPSAPTQVTTNVVAASCGVSDGSINIAGAVGGTSPYTYNFNNGGFSATTSYTGLASGIYPIVVKDANGCTFTTTVTVNNSGGASTVATMIVDSSCGASNGSVTITGVSGGTAPYMYDFGNPANGVFDNGVNNTGLAAGTYTIVVKDANGCLFNTAVTVSNNSGPTGLATIVNNSACGNSDGSVQITGVTGGTSPYTYNFNNCACYTPTTVYNGLIAGSYPIDVKDANGCIFTTSVTIIDNLGPTAIATTVVDATCWNSNGSIILGTVTGGTAPFTFQFNNSGGYGPYSNFTGLAAGSYPIDVKDANGCIFTTSVTVVNNNTPGTAIINYSASSFSSSDTSLQYVTLTGTGPYNGGSYSATPAGLVIYSSNGIIVPSNSTPGCYTVIYNVPASGGCAVVNAITNICIINAPDGIKLNAFIDANNNGIQDGVEVNYNGGQFHYELNNDGTMHNIYSSFGTYNIFDSNATNSYDVSFTTENPNYIVSPSSYTNITVANGSGIMTYNFPVTVTPFTDLRVYIHSQSGPGPGFNYYNYVYVHNNGNLTTPAGTLTYTKDNRLTINNVSPSATMTGTGFTYNYPSLSPGQYAYVSVMLQAPTIPTVQLGDLITNTAAVDIPAGDINTTNNFASLTQVVKGSYDPNDKMESHGPQIVHSTFTSNDYLNYTIRFENTGTADAITVKVDDVLDAKLDETSIKMIDASHNYTLDRVNNNLTWHFDGINLPPSVAGTTIGKGYINFQVKPKAGYSIGDIINNTAYIYFDFNPAIVTNTFATEFVTALGVAGFVNSQFSAYPNPTTGIITIALKNNAGSIDTITVTDILGKTVQSNSVNSANTTVDLSHLTKGLYFVKIQAEGMVKTLKVVKE